MKRPKYHFLTLTPFANGHSFTALPDQTFGVLPVPAGIRIIDKKGQNTISKARLNAKEGEIYFTTSLRMKPNSLTADEIHPLKRNDSVFFPDAEKEFEKYLQKLKTDTNAGL